VNQNVNIFLATSTTTTTTCLPICLNWQCWINISSTIPYSDTTLNSSSTIQTSTTTEIPTLENELLESNNTIQDLQNENFRLKVGLGVGLGAPLAATSAGLVGMYVYFTSR